uniref:ribosomal protein S3 n=1 Tax=Daedalea confragosa TaxID=2028083 RepID=UPI002A80911B|nr:ribosomal protein S3 [Daedaleopsis confragosa]WNZ34409.1 ribosomal protein S3 [Daedaleopsis confragosa]
MDNYKSFLPINNHYSTIDLSTLKSNNFKATTLKRESIDKYPMIEIAKYSKQQLALYGSKESLIINSKIIQNKEEIQSKSSYYTKVDMLSVSPKKYNNMEMQTIIQKYLKLFTTLDIELAKNQSILYEFNSKTLNTKILNNNISKILEYSFFEMSSIISTPCFYVTPKNVIINLFFLVINNKLANKNFLELNKNKLQGLSSKLSKIFKKPINLELTQLYSVSNNSNILVQILGKLGLLRRNSFSRIVGKFLKYQSKKIFFRNNNNKISKFSTILTGVNIKLGGRLIRGKIVPRRTVKKIQYGSLARSKSNFVTTARLTQKNKRGSFSFTVSIGHKFF